MADRESHTPFGPRETNSAFELPPRTRRQFLQAAGLVGLIGVGAAAGGTLGATPAAAEPVATLADAPAKTRATYYTPEKIAAARANIEQYDWARKLADNVRPLADRVAALADDQLWGAVSTQGVPRSYAVNQDLGSPITGRDIYEFGAYPWRADPIARPWKIVDPSSDYVFPTNDFASYYASGLDDHGDFHREDADPQFLVNELYPERGPDWGVDDGFGWIDDNGDKWTLIAYYNHWFCWYGAQVDYSILYQGLNALRDSYLYTGEAKYAHAGLILLDRIADAYPAMDTAPYKRADGYFHSDGLRGTGKVIGGIWETGLARGLVQAYDAFYPAIADEDQAGVIDFLKAKSAQYGLNPKATTADIRLNIENGVLRQIYPAVKTTKIFGNFGMHQSTLSMAAVVLDEPAAAKEWLDFVFAAGGILSNPYRCTGGNVGPQLINVLDRDGWLNEGAIGYNRLGIAHIKTIADILDGYDTYPAADIYANPKYEAMVTTRGTMTMINAYTPCYGDSGTTGQPGLIGSAAEYTAAFAKYGRTVDAQLAYRQNGGSADNLYTDIFGTDLEGLQESIRAAVAEHGELNLPSDHQTGHGFAALRTGTGDQQRGAWLYHGISYGHGHPNTLAIDLYAFGLDLASPLGYPSYADGKALRREWESTTVAENTVLVDAAPQKTHLVGRPLDFGDEGGVRHVDVEAPKPYPQTSRYRRSVIMVDLDDDDSYLVDVFRIRGGSDHLFSFHAVAPAVTTTGLELVAQGRGNYAGPDVPAPDPLGNPRPGANGFDYLVNVERDAQVAGPFTVDWAVPDTWNVHDQDPDSHLRLTMLTKVDEVAFADGIPPQNKPGNPESLRYLLARRRSSKALNTQFVSVIEPYVGQSKITKSEAVRVTGLAAGLAEDDVAAVKLTLGGGRVDYVVHNAKPEIPVLVDGRIEVSGRLAVIRFAGDRVISAVGSDLTKLATRGRGATTIEVDSVPIIGTIADFTRELVNENVLTITLDRPWAEVDTDPADLVGRYVYAADDGERNAAYAITAAEASGSTLKITTDTTFVRGYVTDTDPDAGFRYDVAAGRAVRIPQLRTWRA
ncbi:heparinase II/III domain-containing protein [Microlunatus speluncae]|uniref:heparinase II/III domain-containing protein n=1 Tax=Microlunatus speluncae TaxID=2594267 RepID=UPI0012663EC7|nr:heparinase II/III family protein [Microlunatus speluncae]